MSPKRARPPQDLVKAARGETAARGEERIVFDVWKKILAVGGVLALVLAAGSGCARRGEAQNEEASEGHEARSSSDHEREENEAAEKGQPDRISLDADALANLKLTFAKAEPRDLAPMLQTSAEIVPDPDRRADVGPRIEARVVAFRVKVGDRVERGSPLVVLESAEVGKARADYAAALARAEVARRTHEREQALLASKVTSQREVEAAAAERKIAEAELAAARTRLATFGVHDPDAAVSDPAQVVLRSPIRGSVVARNGHVGRTVEPAESLVEVVDLDELWLLADVYERDLRLVRPGQPVQVEARAYPGEVFRGKADHVSQTLDEKTRTVKVRVVLANPKHVLKPGMFATARIEGAPATGARRMLAVPWAAVQEVDGHRTVFVREGDHAFELRRVRTGERAGDIVEVLNGLDAGDVVVAEGSFLLKGELLKATLGEDE